MASHDALWAVVDYVSHGGRWRRRVGAGSGDPGEGVVLARLHRMPVGTAAAPLSPQRRGVDWITGTRCLYLPPGQRVLTLQVRRPQTAFWPGRFSAVSPSSQNLARPLTGLYVVNSPPLSPRPGRTRPSSCSQACEMLFCVGEAGKEAGCGQCQAS